MTGVHVRFGAAVALVLSLALLIEAKPVWSCSCAPADPAAHYREADAVFIGSMESAAPLRSGPMRSSADPIAYTIAVESVQKGRVSETVVVQSAASGASCGFTFAKGPRYQIYATFEDGVYHTHLCSATAPVGASVYEPDGSRSPEEISIFVGPPSVDDPNRGKAGVGVAAGLLAAAVAFGVGRARRRPAMSMADWTAV